MQGDWIYKAWGGVEQAGQQAEGERGSSAVGTPQQASHSFFFGSRGSKEETNRGLVDGLMAQDSPELALGSTTTTTYVCTKQHSAAMQNAMQSILTGFLTCSATGSASRGARG